MDDIITPQPTVMHPGIRQDRFDNIRYSTVAGPKGTIQGLSYSHVFLPKWAFDLVWNNCTASLSALNKFKLHTTESLINNPALWHRHSGETHKLFGRCMRVLEKAKMLPLNCINPRVRGDKLYQIL